MKAENSAVIGIKPYRSRGYGIRGAEFDCLFQLVKILCRDNYCLYTAINITHIIAIHIHRTDNFT